MGTPRYKALPDEGAKRFCESIANASKRRKTFRFTAFNGCRIRKAPVYTLRVVRKYGTALVRVITDSDHVVEALAVKFPNRLEPVTGNVDSD
jgi:hypothetical protein